MHVRFLVNLVEKLRDLLLSTVHKLKLKKLLTLMLRNYLVRFSIC